MNKVRTGRNQGVQDNMNLSYMLCDRRLLSKTIRGEHMLLDLKSGAHFRLQNIAARIWDYIRKGESGSSIAEKLSREYGIPMRRAMADVSELIADLLKEKLIVPGGKICAVKKVSKDLKRRKDLEKHCEEKAKRAADRSKVR